MGAVRIAARTREQTAALTRADRNRDGGLWFAVAAYRITRDTGSTMCSPPSIPLRIASDSEPSRRDNLDGGAPVHLRCPQIDTAGATKGPGPQRNQQHTEALPCTSKRVFVHIDPIV